jgi:hypothetical protein
MRSSLIFNVSSRFSNRYLLCRMLSASARKMHRDGTSTSQSINSSLKVLHEAEAREDHERRAIAPAVREERLEAQELVPVR